MLGRMWSVQCVVFGCLFGATLQVQSTTPVANGNTSDVPQRPLYRVSTILKEPYVMRKEGNASEFEGFIIDLLNNMSQMAGFDYVVQLSPDGKYGRLNHITGLYDGIIGSLRQGNADIGAIDLISSAQREDVVTFTKPFLGTGTQILIQKPQKFVNTSTILLWPFQMSVWILLCVVTILVVAAFVVIDRFSPFSYKRRADAAGTNPRKHRCMLGLGHSTLFVLSTITWQGYRDVPKSISGRILAIFWWAFSVLVLMSYTANLTCLFLTIGNKLPTFPFKTFDEMSRQSRVSYGGWSDMPLNLNENMQRTMDRFIRSRNSYYSNIEEAVARIHTTDGSYAAIVSGLDGQYAAGVDCNLMLLPEQLFGIGYSMACPLGRQGQALCDKITAAILSLREDGTIYELSYKWWQGKSRCPIAREDEFESSANLDEPRFAPLDLKDVLVGFLILLIGMVISCFALVLEILYRRLRPVQEHNPPIVENNTPQSDQPTYEGDPAERPTETYQVKATRNDEVPDDENTAIYDP